MAEKATILSAIVTLRCSHSVRLARIHALSQTAQVSSDSRDCRSLQDKLKKKWVST
jgi:hypothetical protein